MALFLAFAAVCGAAPPPGDISANGTVTSYDVRLLVDHQLGKQSLTEGPLSSEDANRDGKVDIADAQTINTVKNDTVTGIIGATGGDIQSAGAAVTIAPGVVQEGTSGTVELSGQPAAIGQADLLAGRP